uniref:40S ribosomal protein S30 n=1 Tax=Glossina palpalis gambiensis TaxID=67801 RepID=A0A1B0B158_9MUSC
MLGGNVHGSLVHVGKAEDQIPKVEKNEKREKKTDRATRRVQYNRRFVNIVPAVTLAVIVALMQIFHKWITILSVDVVSYEWICS